MIHLHQVGVAHRDGTQYGVVGTKAAVLHLRAARVLLRVAHEAATLAVLAPRLALRSLTCISCQGALDLSFVADCPALGRLKAVFCATQALLSAGAVRAGHDVSDGGLVVSTRAVPRGLFVHVACAVSSPSTGQFAAGELIMRLELLSSRAASRIKCLGSFWQSGFLEPRAGCKPSYHVMGGAACV